MLKQTQLVGLNNESIKYDSEYIKNKVKEVEKALERIKNIKIDYKNKLIIESYNSATIEGARTTIKSVIKNFENPKSKSDKMVVNNVKALEMIYNGFKIEDGTIRELWEVITHDVCENSHLAGTKYRNGQVYIGNSIQIVHIPCEAGSIQKHMNLLFKYIQNSDDNIIVKSAIVHFYFAYIHPFCDGNGRMARILINYMLYSNGYKAIKKTCISEQINNNLRYYYLSLRYSETPIKVEENDILDITDHISYILSIIKQACIDLEIQQLNLSYNEKKLLDTMKKHGIEAEITVTKAEEILGLSNSGARAVLNKLVNKEILTKQLRNRKMVYILKTNKSI